MSPPHGYKINVNSGRIYWTAYEQGLNGLARRNLFAGEQSGLYDQGYEEGLSVYEETKVRKDPVTNMRSQIVVNQVMQRRNKIDQLYNDIRILEAEITELESQIRRLESGA